MTDVVCAILLLLLGSVFWRQRLRNRQKEQELNEAIRSFREAAGTQEEETYERKTV